MTTDRRRSRHTVRGALVAALLAITSCGRLAPLDPFTDDALDTSGAAAGLADVFNRTGLAPGTAESLDDCPYDPGHGLLISALTDLDFPTTAPLVAGERLTTVDYVDTVDEQFLYCDLAPEDGAGFGGFSVSAAPDDYRSFTETFFNDADWTEPGELVLDFRSSSDHRGGTLHRLCLENTLDPEAHSCEISWVNDDLLIILFYADPTILASDLGGLESALVESLDEIVANLEV